MNDLIILSGQKGSGKSTCGNFLMKSYNYHQMSFAGSLKDIVAWVYDLPRSRLDGLTKEDRVWREQPHYNLRANKHIDWWYNRYKEAMYRVYGNTAEEMQTFLLISALETYIFPYNLSPRQALQIIGTEVFRSIHPDTWCLALQTQIEQLRKQYPSCKIVVTDGRFENEALWGKQQGALLIYVDRPIETDDFHCSEDTSSFKQQADIVLKNDQGLEELEASLSALMACSQLLTNNENRVIVKRNIKRGTKCNLKSIHRKH